VGVLERKKEVRVGFIRERGWVLLERGWGLLESGRGY
jgi:hypothetical protein